MSHLRDKFNELKSQLREDITFVVILDPEDGQPYSVGLGHVAPSNGAKKLLTMLANNKNRNRKKPAQAWLCPWFHKRDLHCPHGLLCEGLHVSSAGYDGRRPWHQRINDTRTVNSRPPTGFLQSFSPSTLPPPPVLPPSPPYMVAASPPPLSSSPSPPPSSGLSGFASSNAFLSSSSPFSSSSTSPLVPYHPHHHHQFAPSTFSGYASSSSSLTNGSHPLSFSFPNHHHLHHVVSSSTLASALPIHCHSTSHFRSATSSPHLGHSPIVSPTVPIYNTATYSPTQEISAGVQHRELLSPRMQIDFHRLHIHIHPHLPPQLEHREPQFQLVHPPSAIVHHHHFHPHHLHLHHIPTAPHVTFAGTSSSFYLPSQLPLAARSVHFATSGIVMPTTTLGVTSTPTSTVITQSIPPTLVWANGNGVHHTCPAPVELGSANPAREENEPFFASASHGSTRSRSAPPQPPAPG